MAVELALQKLEKKLSCPICLDTYTDPKQLQCNHVYCQQCLVRLAIRDQQGHRILTCPNCRQVTPVPASGVAGLQAAFQINEFLEIVEEHKKAKEVTANAEMVKDASLTTHGITAGCKHDGKEAVLYCETCKETICIKCTKKGAQHNNHDYFELDEALERYKKQVMAFLEPVEKQLGTSDRALAELDMCHEEVFNQRAAIEANIHSIIALLHQTLDVRRIELIDQLHRLTQAKFKSLAAQKDQIKTTQAQLSSCLEFMRENLKTGKKGEAMLMKNSTLSQVQILTSTFQPDLLEPNTKADMFFSSSEDLTTAIQNFGRVKRKDSPNPSKCTASGEGTKVAAIQKKSTVLLKTLSFDDLPCKEALDSITCELVSDMTGTKVRGSVEREEQSQYKLGYQPTIKGRHQLHIKVDGQHIKESPFLVTATSPVEKLGTPILTIGRVGAPEGVAVNQRGDVFVTEWDGHRIIVVSASGERQSFGSRGFGQGQFSFPRGVAVDGEGCILVADTNNHRIQKFTADGKFLTAVGTEGTGPLLFKEPHGIAYNASNSKVYVADNGNNCVHILNSNLSHVDSFGKKGKGKGQFHQPQYLACDPSGNVYVADYGNHRIQVFTADGRFLGKFGGHGGEQWEPVGVAIDFCNRVYVSDVSNHCISVFTSKDQFVTSFGGKGSGQGQFKTPTGIAVDASGVVYVCDYWNKRVQIF